MLWGGPPHLLAHLPDLVERLQGRLLLHTEPTAHPPGHSPHQRLRGTQRHVVPDDGHVLVQVEVAQAALELQGARGLLRRLLGRPTT